MTADEFDVLTVGPDETLVLIVRSPIPVDELVRVNELVPKHLHGRVLVIDGRDFDVAVIQRGAA